MRPYVSEVAKDVLCLEPLASVLPRNSEEPQSRLRGHRRPFKNAGNDEPIDEEAEIDAKFLNVPSSSRKAKSISKPQSRGHPQKKGSIS